MSNQNKAIVSVGYNKYVVDADDAITLTRIMMSAEKYREVWRKQEDGGTTYHVWEPEHNEMEDIGIKVLPSVRYKMYKLAGKPQE